MSFAPQRGLPAAVRRDDPFAIRALLVVIVGKFDVRLGAFGEGDSSSLER